MSVFKPRRSSKGRMDQTGTTGKYANAVLGAGELFLERQQTGTGYTEGSGLIANGAEVQYRMKIGDGSTKYSALGYADQTQVAKSGSSGDGNLVGNVEQNKGNGGITATFQSLADKKVSSVTSNSSDTVTDALNTVSDNNTLKDILGALKQAVSLCNTAISNKADSTAIPTKTSQLTNDSGYITSAIDTKNTAGTGNTTGKIYLAGGTSQNSDGVTTYSNSNCYAQNGFLYSNGKQVSTTDHTHSGYLTAQQDSLGYTWLRVGSILIQFGRVYNNNISDDISIQKVSFYTTFATKPRVTVTKSSGGPNQNDHSVHGLFTYSVNTGYFYVRNNKIDGDLDPTHTENGTPIDWIAIGKAYYD